MKNTKLHPDYYSPHGNFTLEIGGFLFKISDIKFWTHSQFFYLVSRENGKTLKDVTNEKNATAENHEGYVWNLKDVKVEDFVSLLWILYPLKHGECQVKTLEQWEGVLTLADRWKFTDIFDLATRELHKLTMDPVKKIGLMHQFKIQQEWALDSLVALTLLPEFPDDAVTEILGIKLTTRLAKAREKLSYSFPPWNRKRVEPAKRVVCEVFGLKGQLSERDSWRNTEL